MPNNISNWQVFEDDEQILEFLHCEKTFKNAVIDEKEHDSLMNEREDEEKDQSNMIPKLVVKMEHLYDLHGKFKKPPNCKMHSSSMKYESVTLEPKKTQKLLIWAWGALHKKRLHLLSCLKSIRMSLHGHMVT